MQYLRRLTRLTDEPTEMHPGHKNHCYTAQTPDMQADGQKRKYVMEELVPILGVIGITAIVLAPFVVAIICVVKKAGTDRARMQKQSELLSQIVEKGNTENLDFDAIAAAFSEHTSVKQSILKSLRSGLITSLLGLAMLALGIVGSVNPDAYEVMTDSVFYVAAGILLSCGIALVVYAFIAKKTLRKEIEQEEQQALNGK